MLRTLSSTLSKEGFYATLATLGPALLGGWIYTRYQARGHWYDRYGSDDAILIAVIVGSIATFAAVGNFLDPQRRKLSFWWLAPSVIVLGSALFIAGCWVYPWPSLDAAEAALAAHDFERAEAEIAALEARDPGSPEVAALWAQLPEQRAKPQTESADDRRLASMGNAGLAMDTTLVLRRTWQDPDKRELARRRVVERARAIADDAWEQRDGPKLAQILEDTTGLDDDLTRELTQRAALAYARNCMDKGELDCVDEALAKLDPDVPLDSALQAIREAIEAELQAAKR